MVVIENSIDGNLDATNTNSLTIWYMFSYEFLAGQIDDTYPQPNHSITMFQNNQRMKNSPSAKGAKTSSESKDQALLQVKAVGNVW